MHHGFFVGKETAKMSKQVLILAESHHVGKNNPKAGVPADYKTETVLRRDYYNAPTDKNYRMFDKIMTSFGIEPVDPSHRISFWESFYFANYIDVLCGVGDSAAKKTIKADHNRLRYNNELFDFLNRYAIEYVFCFSRLVYGSLPGYSNAPAYREQEQFADIPCGFTNGRRDYISKCIYLSGIPHAFSDVVLDHAVQVFGMRHPSGRGGFDPTKYRNTLGPIFQNLK